jgi:anaerobic C4-dicarboxylate transporter DcuB
MITFSMILQLCIVLGALWVGSRYGSLAYVLSMIIY